MHKYLITFELRTKSKDIINWEYSGVVECSFKIQSWEDINKVVQSIWEEKFEFKTYADGLENRMLKIICLQELT